MEQASGVADQVFENCFKENENIGIFRAGHTFAFTNPLEKVRLFILISLFSFVINNDLVFRCC